VFLMLAPLELCAVLIMVSLELGAAPAFAGIAALLALIPLQVRMPWMKYSLGSPPKLLQSTDCSRQMTSKLNTSASNIEALLLRGQRCLGSGEGNAATADRAAMGPGSSVHTCRSRCSISSFRIPISASSFVLQATLSRLIGRLRGHTALSEHLTNRLPLH